MGGVRLRWQSTRGGASRSAAPVGPSGDGNGGEDPDSKKKSGWRDMDPTLVKHGAHSSRASPPVPAALVNEALRGHASHG